MADRHFSLRVLLPDFRIPADLTDIRSCDTVVLSLYQIPQTRRKASMFSTRGSFSYQIIRSDRRTMSIIVRQDDVIVRAPWHVSESEIIHFVESHADWVLRKLSDRRKQQNVSEKIPPLSASELRKLHAQAAAYIPRRVAYYAPIVGVTYGTISFRMYKSKWGSCKADGSLAFNILLMLAPPDVIDSVIVHELCHRIEMNHSQRFYREVLRVCPDYHEKHQWLKDHQSEIMAQGGYS